MKVYWESVAPEMGTPFFVQENVGVGTPVKEAVRVTVSPT
jgi:hypothetical protein